MGQCVSIPKRSKRSRRPGCLAEQQQQAPCVLERLPHEVFISILMLLDQQELMQTVPLVCSAWQQTANQAMDRLVLNLSSPERQQQLPYMFTWLQEHGQQLKQLQLSTSTALGRAARKAFLRSLVSQRCRHSSAMEPWAPIGHATINSITNSSGYDPSSWGSSSTPINRSTVPNDSVSRSLVPRPMQDSPGRTTTAPISPQHCKLQLQQLVLQMDLDVIDLLFLANHVVQHAPQLNALKLQPLKPSLADLQLLVLACIVGNLVGADSPGPVLPHLTGCGAAVASIASVSPQLRSLSLSRYDVGSVASVTAASQLTSLALLHCSLRDGGLRGLPSLRHLQKLELSDNNLTWSCLGEVACLAQLTHLDLSVMPSRCRMRSAHLADISPLTRLKRLRHLNLIGFGVADVTPLGGLALHTLEVGLNPLSRGSLKAIGRISTLESLELGGVSQAWMLSSSLPPDISARAHSTSWCGLSGLSGLTALDLGGSHFTNAVWVCHMCPLLAGMSSLQRLMLAHCNIPAGKMQQLLPGLSQRLEELNIDRCPASGDELLGLVHLTRLTRLSACSMSPELDNKQAALWLAHLTSLQHLVARSNKIGARGAQVLAKGLTALTCLDLGNCPIGKRATKQLAHLLAPAVDMSACHDLDTRCW